VHAELSASRHRPPRTAPLHRGAIEPRHEHAAALAADALQQALRQLDALALGVKK
jgi:hypothetical protein